MTGTSMDGIDISLVETNGLELNRINKNYFYEYSDNTKLFLMDVLKTDLDFNLKRKKLLDDFITIEHYQALKSLEIVDSSELIGFHGQTIYHNPKKKISIQLGNPKLLSKLLKKNVVFNFRLQDIKMGGQGAPLAPIYHKYIMQSSNFELPSCFLNIGGVANLTFWDGKTLLGFDTGPGNALMDDLIKKTSNNFFDKDGALASKGSAHNLIIKKILNHSYFNTPPPKSLDRNFFDKVYNEISNLEIPIQDKMSTLAELTIETIILSIEKLPKKIKNIIVTGGGNKNIHLMKNLKERLDIKFIYENEVNINFDFIESELIAFLSARSIYNLPITFPSTTGVSSTLSGGEIFRHL